MTTSLKTTQSLLWSAVRNTKETSTQFSFFGSG